MVLASAAFNMLTRSAKRRGVSGRTSFLVDLQISTSFSSTCFLVVMALAGSCMCSNVISVLRLTVPIKLVQLEFTLGFTVYVVMYSESKWNINVCMWWTFCIIRVQRSISFRFVTCFMSIHWTEVNLLGLETPLVSLTYFKVCLLLVIAPLCCREKGLNRWFSEHVELFRIPALLISCWHSCVLFRIGRDWISYLVKTKLLLYDIQWELCKLWRCNLVVPSRLNTVLQKSNWQFCF